jgi:hypothetical protein
MITKSVETQAREYIYDVKNCASEYGQSTLEGWEFSLVSDVQKIKIEKNYYPTVAAHPAQELLFALFKAVKSKLMIPLSGLENGFDITSAANKDITYLIAFNEKLHR